MTKSIPQSTLVNSQAAFTVSISEDTARKIQARLNAQARKFNTPLDERMSAEEFVSQWLLHEPADSVDQIEPYNR